MMLKRLLLVKKTNLTAYISNKSNPRCNKSLLPETVLQHSRHRLLSVYK